LAQEGHKARLVPFVDGAQRLGGDVWRVPLVDSRALQPFARNGRAHEVARRVAIAAVCQRLDQIGAAVPLWTLGWILLVVAFGEEQPAPRHQREADVERESELVAALLLLDRRDAAEVGPQRLEVVLRDER